MKPVRLPLAAIHSDAGTVAIVVPRNIEAMGAVASPGALAICAPASPPTVTTSAAAV